MEFKDRLKELREEHGMSQIEISKAIFDTYSTIEYYENGYLPDINNIIKIADYFGVIIDYLVGRNNERKSK
jgi:transcriptional regulator with XRE-family HTH domain